jgi:hypothetical protein
MHTGCSVVQDAVYIIIAMCVLDALYVAISISVKRVSTSANTSFKAINRQN